MKKLIKHSMKIKTLHFFILAIFLLFNPFYNALNAQEAFKSADEIFVNYVGSSGGQPVFLLRFFNKDMQYEHLRISNKEGLVLHKEKLSEESFAKRFQIDIPSEESVDLIILFTDKEGKRTKKYIVSSNMLMVRNVEVTKL